MGRKTQIARGGGGRRKRGRAIELRESDARKLEEEVDSPTDGEASEDSEAEFERENELLQKRMQLQGTEGAADEETSEGDEEEDSADEDETEMAEDDEDEDDDDPSGGLRTAWGRKASDYYHGESSEGDSSDDEEAMELRAREAERVLEKDQIQGLTREHFGSTEALEGLQVLLKLRGKAPLEDVSSSATPEEKESFWQRRVEAEVDSILEGFEATVKSQPEEMSSLAGLSEEEQKALLDSTHPELVSLVGQMESSMSEVSSTLDPLLAMVKSGEFLTKDGLTLLDAKNQLLLTYLSYLAYYVLLKTHGLPINNHPVIERLIEVKLLIQKLQPLERAVKPEIDRLVEIARKEAGDSSSVPSIRARPEAFVPVGAEDSSSASDGEREEGAEASEQDEEDSDREAEAAGDGSTSKYRPPKMMAVEFTGDKISSVEKAEKNLQRAAARMQRSELVRAVREATGDAPETVGIERWLAAKAHGGLDFVSERKSHDDDDEADFWTMRRSLSKKERKATLNLSATRASGVSSAQAAKRALYERRSAQALGDSLDDLAVFAEQSVGITDADDPLFGAARPQTQKPPKGVLGRYLNAAKQAAEEAAKLERARADSLVLSREIQERPFKRSEAKPRRTPGDVSLAESEDDAEFRELAGAARQRKEQKKARMKQKALSFLPKIDEEVEGQRAITRDIEKNRGLTRKRKKFEGNARVNNRLKFAKKAKKLKSIRPEMRAFEDRGYEGEVSGIRSHLKKSRTLS